ncbi:MAG: sigma-70 family RNA polymerase sigma factor [Armatimonadota bacterium]
MREVVLTLKNKYYNISKYKMVNDTDQNIVERVHQGDLDSFSEIVKKYQDRIYSTVLNYVGNPEDALDVTQDAFVKAYTRLDSFNKDSAFYTWLYRIAINTAIDFLRKRKSRPAISLSDEKFTESGFEPEAKDNYSDPVRTLYSNEQMRELRYGLTKLSEKLRSVIILHDIQGMSQDEVAEILKIPVGTVKSRVSRARNTLKDILRSKGDTK